MFPKSTQMVPTSAWCPTSHARQKGGRFCQDRCPLPVSWFDVSPAWWPSIQTSDLESHQTLRHRSWPPSTRGSIFGGPAGQQDEPRPLPAAPPSLDPAQPRDRLSSKWYLRAQCRIRSIPAPVFPEPPRVREVLSVESSLQALCSRYQQIPRPSLLLKCRPSKRFPRLKERPWKVQSGVWLGSTQEMPSARARDRPSFPCLCSKGLKPGIAQGYL